MPVMVVSIVGSSVSKTLYLDILIFVHKLYRLTL